MIEDFPGISLLLKVVVVLWMILTGFAGFFLVLTAGAFIFGGIPFKDVLENLAGCGGVIVVSTLVKEGVQMFAESYVRKRVEP